MVKKNNENQGFFILHIFENPTFKPVGKTMLFFNSTCCFAIFVLVICFANFNTALPIDSNQAIDSDNLEKVNGNLMMMIEPREFRQSTNLINRLNKSLLKQRTNKMLVKQNKKQWLKVLLDKIANKFLMGLKKHQK